MINKYLAVGIILIIFAVISSYIAKFYDHPFSSDTGAWGELGDYMGGMLNPILSFTSLVFILKSLSLQNQANRDLSTQIRNSERAEKIRSFEARLFNMIDAQKESFNSLKIKMKINRKTVIKQNIEAVIELENEIERLRILGKAHQEIAEFIESTDHKDQIYCVTRTFYVMVKMISENLSGSEGFTKDERKFYFINLINFTDFSLLRLILIAAYFTDNFPTEYLKKNEEFVDALESVKLKFDIYSQ